MHGWMPQPGAVGGDPPPQPPDEHMDPQVALSGHHSCTFTRCHQGMAAWEDMAWAALLQEFTTCPRECIKDPTVHGDPVHNLVQEV